MLVTCATGASVDMTGAGEGSLSACVDDGATESGITKTGSKQFAAEFVPPTAGSSKIDITFNDFPVPGTRAVSHLNFGSSSDEDVFVTLKNRPVRFG